MSTDQHIYPAPSQNDPVYFPVSATKLIVLSLCSFGMYELYWFYKNWKLEMARTGEKLSPFWRTFFAPLFAYSLFKRIKEFGDGSSPPVEYSPGLLAVAFVALNVSWRLPAPFWLVATLAFLPLLPVRAAVAAINLQHAPQSDTNGEFSGGNILLVVVGGLLLLLAVVGTFLPAGAP